MVVIVSYARNITDFAMSNFPDSTLISKALMMVYKTRTKPSDVLFYSNQGIHYMSKRFIEPVACCHEMRHSTSRKGLYVSITLVLRPKKTVLC